MRRSRCGLSRGDVAERVVAPIGDIGLKRERTYAYGAMIDPFIKLEVKLKAVEGGENLLLLRNRSHSETPESASIRYACQMMKFLK